MPAWIACDRSCGVKINVCHTMKPFVTRTRQVHVAWTFGVVLSEGLMKVDGGGGREEM